MVHFCSFALLFCRSSGPSLSRCVTFLKDPSTSGTLVGHTAPQYSHTDKWELSGNTLTRTHKRSRATFFSPAGTKDPPVGLEDLADERTTFLEYEDGSKETLVDNWREVENPKERCSQCFVGKTVFKLKSAPTGKRRLRKRSTFPEPQPLQEPETTGPQEHFKKKVLKEASVEDTFRHRLAQAAAGTLEELKTALLEQLREQDPATQQPYTHDLWLNFPTVWVRMHYEPRESLFVPNDPNFEEQLGDGRMTLLVRPERDALWHCDEWRRAGVGETSEPFVGATCFEKATLDAFDVEPEGQDFVAQKASGLKQPGEPTLTERLEHELTHLPFKPWCEVCLRAKSRQAKSRKLSLRQPVLQMDFSFLSDKPGDDSVTILNVVDVLTGMSLSVVIPTKSRTTYSQAELRRFVVEIGRTFGVLQCDPEPALRSIAEAVTGEVGGLSLRNTPKGWKQAQGSVGNMQATLYGQIKALRLELLMRYNVELSVHSALFTWLVRHAQWLVNRYLQNVQGTTAFERRWGRGYNGALCRFGETVLFRREQHKGKLSWFHGIWLGKDTESDQHFVADATGVFKTRSVKRLPPSKQSDLSLLQSVKARPWDPTGSKAETTLLSSRPTRPRRPALDPSFGVDARQTPRTCPYLPCVNFSETLKTNRKTWKRTFLSQKPQVKRQAQLWRVQAQTLVFFEPPALRPRLEEALPSSPTKRSTETLDVGTSKVQRIASVTFDKQERTLPVCDFRDAAVTTKSDLEGPVHVNQDVGREIRRTADARELYMKPEYIDSMLQLYNMSACKPAAAPGFAKSSGGAAFE